MLERFDDKNFNLQEKPLKGFKRLSEIKNSRKGPRIIVHRRKNKPPEIVHFCRRRDLTKATQK